MAENIRLDSGELSQRLNPGSGPSSALGVSAALSPREQTDSVGGITSQNSVFRRSTIVDPQHLQKALISSVAEMAQVGVAGEGEAAEEMLRQRIAQRQKTKKDFPDQVNSFDNQHIAPATAFEQVDDLAQSNYEREIGVEHLESDSDDIGEALKRVRDIPLETYLNQEKAAQVLRARTIRQRQADKEKAAKIAKGLVVGPDDNRSQHANSGYAQTGWSGMKNRQRRAFIEQQYKDMAVFHGLDKYISRRQNAMKKSEIMTLEQRVGDKREKWKRLQKLALAGKRASSEDQVSSWSEQVPEIEPLIPRGLQFENRIPPPHLQTLVEAELPSNADKQVSVLGRSQKPTHDAESSEHTQMQVTKGRRVQTMTQYDLVPEVIYNSMEIKIRELIRDINGPTIARQEVLTKDHQDLYMKSQQFDVRLRDCQLGIKKQLNMKAEFETMNERMEAQDLNMKKMETMILRVQQGLENKIEKNAAQTRVLQSDLKSTSKFVQKKNDDASRLQEIISTFKDRLMEKYASLSDEYTEQFKSNTTKMLTIREDLSKLFKAQESFNGETQQLKINLAKEMRQLSEAQESIEALKKCYKFGPRIDLLENQAKSDLIAVTTRLDDILRENRKNLKRNEAMKVIYSLQTSMQRDIFDLKKHKSGRLPTHENPRLEPEVQARINMIDWQLKFGEKHPFVEDFTFDVMTELGQQADALTMKQLRRERFVVEINARKLGRKVERCHSLPKELQKSGNLIKIDLPEAKKKLVCFAAPPSLTSLSSLKSGKDSSHDRNKTLNRQQSLSSKPSRSNLRKINKILEPFRQRELVQLSQLKRSGSFVWVPKVKPTLDNLYEDKTSINMLDKLKTNMGGSLGSQRTLISSSRILPGSGSRAGTHRQAAGASEKPVTGGVGTSEGISARQKRLKKVVIPTELDKTAEEVVEKPRKERKKKERQPREKSKGRRSEKRSRGDKSSSSYNEVTSSNVSTGQAQQSKDQRPAGLLETVDEENKGQRTQKLQSKVDRKHLSNSFKRQTENATPRGETSDSASRSQTPISPEMNRTSPSFAKKAKRNVTKLKIKRDPSQQTSDSEALFSSEDDQSEEEISPALYEAFVTQADFDEDLDLVKDELREEILDDAKALVTEQVTEMVGDQIGAAQVNLAEMLQQQLLESQDAMKEHMNSEVSIVKHLMDSIKNKILPENQAKIQNQLHEATITHKQELADAIASVADSIKMFKQKVEFFETDVAATQTKFRRLVSDQDIFRSRVEKIQKRTQQMVKVMRAEQLASSKLMSTLVELEFIQQSLDFQDEFDKTQMHLYGLNDLNMTLEDFIAKSSEIASRRTRHEAMQYAKELESTHHNKFGRTGAGGNELFDLTDSGTYQAITMGDEWQEQLGSDSIRKQIHQAFKLACVYYQPSPVLYRGHKYARRDLIEAKRQVLDADWHLLQKFQPFKRMWGEDSEVDFYEQFAKKLAAVIQGNKKGADVGKLMIEQAEDTFVKIMAGTNINDMKLASEVGQPDDLMSSDNEQEPARMAAKGGSGLSLAGSGGPLKFQEQKDMTQSSIKLREESQETREASKLQNSARYHNAIEKISNRKQKQGRVSPENTSNTIESRTRSMLNAIQGKSIFGPNVEESIFSSAEVLNSGSHSKANSRGGVQDGHKTKSRGFTRSVQKTESQNPVIFSEFLHQPFWMNQSQVIYEHGNVGASDALVDDAMVLAQNSSKMLGTKASELQQMKQMHQMQPAIKAQINRKTNLSSSRNQQNLQYFTEKNTMGRYDSQTRGLVSPAENSSMFEMRPLIGKEQLRQHSKYVTQGTGAMDREGVNLNTTDYLGGSKGFGAVKHAVNAVGRQTQLSVSPWAGAGSQAARKEASRGCFDQGQNKAKQGSPIDMSIIGKKENLADSSPMRHRVASNRNLKEHLQRSQVVKPTTVNFPLNLPINTINMSMQSPLNSDTHRTHQFNDKNANPVSSGNSQSVLTLPKVGRNATGQIIHGVTAYGEDQHHVLKGNLGTKQSSYASLAESRFNSGDLSKQQQRQGAKFVSPLQTRPILQQHTDGVNSAASLWTPEDDMGNKMQAKLASQQQNSNVQSESNLETVAGAAGGQATSFNMQKLKDIARQKKQLHDSIQQSNNNVSSASATGDGPEAKNK